MGEEECMSVAPSRYPESLADFSALLTHYPSLAGWLADSWQNEEEPQAEKLFPSFLAACSEQGVLESAYPFTATSRALEDLRTYLRVSQAEIDAFMKLPASGREKLDSEPATHGGEEKAETGSVDVPTQKVTSQILTAGVAARSESSTERIACIKEHSQRAQDVLVDDEHSEVPTVSMPAAIAEEISSDTEKTTTAGMALPGDNGLLSPGRRRKRNRQPRTRRQRLRSSIMLGLLLGAILVPLVFLMGFGVSAYTTYRSLSSEAHSAVNHLLDIKNMLKGEQGHLNAFLDPLKLRQVERDFVASSQDFQHVRDQLRQSNTLQTVITYLPQYRAALSSALAASIMGVDVSRIGQIAIRNVMPFTASLRGPLLASSSQPLITQPMLDAMSMTLEQISPLLGDIQMQSHNVALDSLPLSTSEKSQLGSLLQILPQVLDDFRVVHTLLGDAGWLLGVGQPRTFLVQTMDRAELRATGGFTGQYGELQVNGGRVAPFSLTDIGPLEESAGSTNLGRLAPEQYRSWWPFANWGLRDSNVSADFPSTAQTAIDLYKQETGHQIDGVISFTPIVIEHVLALLGPVQVPGYNTSVTAQNLEKLLHYYQLDNAGILKQELKQQANSSTSVRKQFTSLLASLLMARVRGASPGELLSIAHQMFFDLKNKDLQIYFTDPAAEHILMQYNYAGQLDRSATHDGFFVVQENLSASKASQYVQTTLNDSVTLDDRGGATHLLQIHLVYNQAGPVYGYDTYYDYLRVYVPPDSRLLSGDGFSSTTPLCGGSYGSCPLNDVYPDGELICPAGQYQPGAMPPTLTDPSGADWQPLYKLGGPTNTHSDEPGRAMYGGWVVVPKNCTMNVTLSWYVPPLAQHRYSLLVQRQAGTFPELNLSIVPDAADCAQLATAGLHFDGVLTQDASFTPPVYKPVQQRTQGCYPHSGV